MKKIVSFIGIMEIIFLLVLLTIIGIIVAGFFPFQHDILSDYAIKNIKKSGIDSCSIEKIAVTPWKQIDIARLYLKDSSSGGSYEISTDNIHIELSLLSILLNKREASEMISDLKKNLHQSDAKNSLARTIIEIFRFSEKIAHVKKMNVGDCSVNYEDENANRGMLKKLNLEIKPLDKSFKKYQSSFQIEEMKHNDDTIKMVKGMNEYCEGVVTLDKCRGLILDSQFKLKGNISLITGRLSDVRFEITDLNLSRYARKSLFGPLNGRADFEISLGESPFIRDSLRGKGRLILSDITIISIPLQKAMSSLLGIPRFDFLKFNKIITDFEMSPGNNYTNNMKGSGRLFEFTSVGWLNSNNEINQKIEGIFSPEYVRTLPEAVANSMETTSDNGRKFNCRIYGTFDHFKMELGQETLKKAVGSVFENMRQSLQGFFNK